VDRKPLDIVVVGASAGGVELTRLVNGFSADLPAAVFVVLHMSPNRPSALPAVLDRAGPLAATRAVDGEAIEHGRIYVASPNQHLYVHRRPRSGQRSWRRSARRMTRRLARPRA
jgi:two-component system chemotaxis response regulator CheB